MASPFRSDIIGNWVGDFCSSDAVRNFSSGTREYAPEILATFLESACAARDIDPADIEQPDVRAALVNRVARLQLPASVRREIPDLCAALLTQLEQEGRLSGGRALGTFARALRESFEGPDGGKPKPHINPGSKINRNDPCPCGSGLKYKKCCMGG